MKRVLKRIIGVFFLLESATSLYLLFTESDYQFAFLFIGFGFGAFAFLLLKPPKKKITSSKTECIADYVEPESVVYKPDNVELVTTPYIETPNTIDRIDGQPISDEEIPHLIEIGKEKAMEQFEQSENPIFHRTEREENLATQFMLNHSDEIQKHTDSFEEHNRLAYAEKDLNRKIELLQETVNLYEKEKKWFYRTKGGIIYFQDFYEHLHNSKNKDFSYIDLVKKYLEDCIIKRDYIIPEILNLITSLNGILQKDIYKYLPNISKSEIQRTIRELETENLVTRTKKGNSYFLTLTQ